uniref:Uncharacterized protein n=1 Tax=Trichuris muris TaxID=70415 RepID=A0A5S6QK75_TRIMR
MNFRDGCDFPCLSSWCSPRSSLLPQFLADVTFLNVGSFVGVLLGAEVTFPPKVEHKRPGKLDIVTAKIEILSVPDERSVYFQGCSKLTDLFKRHCCPDEEDGRPPETLASLLALGDDLRGCRGRSSRKGAHESVAVP